MADCYIRNLKPEVKSKLEEQAKSKGISLNEYVKNLLTVFALNNDVKTLDEKYNLLMKDITSIYLNLLEQTTQQIEANTEGFKRVEERLKRLEGR